MGDLAVARHQRGRAPVSEGWLIVLVEVIEIQIWFEFKLICNLKNGFEKEKNFLFKKRHLGRIHSAAQPAGAAAQRIRGRAPRSGSKPDPIAPDPTR
jgi:hypothetical protein